MKSLSMLGIVGLVALVALASSLPNPPPEEQAPAASNTMIEKAKAASSIRSACHLPSDCPVFKGGEHGNVYVAFEKDTEPPQQIYFLYDGGTRAVTPTKVSGVGTTFKAWMENPFTGKDDVLARDGKKLDWESGQLWGASWGPGYHYDRLGSD